ncbi:hypothetical protein LCGC14_0641690 [marine sediment metagenome]|uniref:Uncharacterized protein n=1 Tax=marine sediment metagenome TaxID=412755 RepID=A0A0F9TKE5_9ZZZZ
MAEVTVNAVVSDELQVKPLQEGEIVKYRLVSAGKKEPGRLKPAVASNYQIVGEENIKDPFGGAGAEEDAGSALIYIQNITAWGQIRLPSGEVQRVPETTGIIFENGGFTCTWENNETYFFLERSKKNLSNKWRDKRVKAIFYKVNDQEESKKQLAMEDLYADAVIWMREADMAELKSIAKKLERFSDHRLKVGDLNDITEIRLKLMQIAKRDARAIIVSSGDKASKKKVQIREAETYNILLFVDSARMWRFYGGEQEELLQVEPGMDRYGALFDHFTSDEGLAAYQKVINQLKKIYKVTA